MNAERLHTIAKSLLLDLAATNTESNLRQLVGALQNQVNQPAHPQFQQQVGQLVATLEKDLAAAPSGEFSPTWRQTLEAIGVEALLGIALWHRIQEIFTRNTITPSVALQEIQGLHTEVSELVSALSNMVSAFELLGVGSEELGVGECEVGVLLPRTLVNSELSRLGKELSDLDQIFSCFAEVSTGSRPSFHVRTIASSDFSIFFGIDPHAAACIAVGVERVVALYKNLLEVKRLHKELAEQGLDKKTIKGVEEFADTLMSKGIDEVADDLLKRYYSARDSGRRNELRIELKMSLHKVANRIDRGLNVEVRANPPEDGGGEAAKNSEDGGESEDFSTIKQVSTTLQFLKVSGNPILNLPEKSEGKSGRKDP